MPRRSLDHKIATSLRDLKEKDVNVRASDPKPLDDFMLGEDYFMITEHLADHRESPLARLFELAGLDFYELLSWDYLLTALAEIYLTRTRPGAKKKYGPDFARELRSAVKAAVKDKTKFFSRDKIVGDIAKHGPKFQAIKTKSGLTSALRRHKIDVKKIFDQEQLRRAKKSKAAKSRVKTAK